MSGDKYLLDNIFSGMDKDVCISNHSRQGYDPILLQTPVFFDALAKRLLYGVSPEGRVDILTVSTCLDDTLDFEHGLGYTGAVTKILPMFENIEEVLGNNGCIDFVEYEKRLFTLFSGQRSLFMAAPIDDNGCNVYGVPYLAVEHVNDKANLPDYVDSRFLPNKYMVTKGTNGSSESGSLVIPDMQYPVMVKACDLSSGEGIFKCTSNNEIYQSLSMISHSSKVIIEQYIEHTAQESFGVQYSITTRGECSIIGVAYQLLDGTKYVGSLFNSFENGSLEESACSIVEQSILPRIYSEGVFGYGSVDVVVDSAARNIMVLEINHRVTGATTGMCRSGFIEGRPAMSHSIYQNGGTEINRGIVKKLVSQQIVDPNGLSEYGDESILNSIIVGDDMKELQEKVDTMNKVCGSEVVPSHVFS